MGYPTGAGPEAGRFWAGPFQAVDGGAAQGARGRPRPLVVPADARLIDGKLTAVIGTPSSGGWLITRMTVTATVAAKAFCYAGPRTLQNLITGTNSGQLDEYDPNQPLYVPEGQELSIQWETATGSATARVEYWEL